MPSAVRGDQVPGHQGPERAGAAGDQHRAVGVERRRQGQHDLADVPGLLEVAERVRGLAHVPGGHRRLGTGAVGQQPEDGGEHLVQPLGRRLRQQVVGPVDDIRQGGRVTRIGLAQLQQPAAGPQHADRGVEQLAGQ